MLVANGITGYAFPLFYILSQLFYNMSQKSRLTVRAAALTGLTALCRSYEVSAPAILREAGLPATIETEPDRRVPVGTVNMVLELAALACGRQDFGLRLSELRGFSNLGPISLLARDEPTVGDALHAIANYLPLHNDALSVSRERHVDIVILRSTVFAPNPKVQATDIAVAMQHRIVARLAGANWTAEHVYLTRPRPDDITMFHKIFGRHIDFGAEFDGIVVKSDLLDKPNPMADTALRPYALESLRLYDPGSEASIADRAKRLIETLLSNRRCTAGYIALQLGMSRRTLTRALEAQGTTFLAVLNEARTEIARRHVEGGTRRLSDISDLLGFSSQSAFSSWFVRQFGTNPRHWRQRHGRNIKTDDPGFTKFERL